MNKKQFIENEGVTFQKWSWSWSYINHKRKFVIFVAIILIFTSVNSANAKRGYISNSNNTKCWYNQIEKSNYIYFYKKHTANTKILTFDKPDCMYGKEFKMSINKTMINNIIVRFGYSHPDADFATREHELYNNSRFPQQVKGKCIQSNTYKNVGVAINYVIKNNSIVEVYHADTAAGCKK